MKKIVIILTLLFSGILAVNAQCPEAQSFIKYKKDKSGYVVSSQSKSGNLESGEVYETVFIAQPGMDYRVTIQAVSAEVSCNYEIYEMVVVKTMEDGKARYQKEKQVLFSSTDPEKLIEFSSEGMRKLYISVSTSGSDPKSIDCVGVLIEQKRSLKIGF